MILLKNLKTLQKNDKFLTPKERKILNECIDELNEFMRNFPDASKDQIEKKRKDIMERAGPILDRVKAMKELEDLGKKIQERKDALGNHLTPQEKKAIDNIIRDIKEWIEDHPDGKKR